MHAGDLIANRYRLDDRIDGGAMGDVWRGTDTRLNRVVAIKLLHSGLSDNARFRARFHQEAQAVAALQAPGVVSLYDYGEDTDGGNTVSYLIMELVKGTSLANYLQERGSLDPRETLRIIAAAADALHAAHQAGIVHRDVKPANMLIDGNGNVKIVDFGIARAKGEAGLTETGMVMGTVAYTSPEQLCDHELTPASDVYSLGIVAYECLAGRPPFVSTNPGAAINGHMNQQPPPLPQSIPRPVADVVMRALAKEPTQRWRSAAEFAQACREVASGGATTALLAAPPMSPPTRQMTAARGMASPDRTTGSRPAARPAGMQREAPPEPESKSNKGLVVLAVLAVLALLAGVIALVTLTGGDGAPAADDDKSSAAETPKDDKESTEETEPEDDDSPDDDQQNEPTQPSDETSDVPDEPQEVPVPSVIGKPLGEAITTLSNNEFVNIQTTYDGDTGDEACTVIDQDPEANESIPTGDLITLTVSGTKGECEQ